VVNGSNIKVYLNNNTATADSDCTDPGVVIGLLEPTGSVELGSPGCGVYFDDLVVTTF
jgi:hypothetical protein